MKKILYTLLFLNFIAVLSQEKWMSKSVIDFQKELNTDYADAAKSPLTKEDLKVFNTLDFFEINPKLAVTAKFVRTKKEKSFQMKTSTSRTPTYKKYGEYIFEIETIRYKLSVYQNIELVKNQEYKNYLFLPFSDLTNGKQTYIGGRYIDMKIPTSKTVIIDFNKAYNPYCAYNHNYSCPIVPLENDLNIEITAGVKKFHD